MTVTTARPYVDTHATPFFRWDLETLERGGGVAWVQRGPRYTRVRASDSPPEGMPTRTDDLRWHSATEAWLSADGSAVVRSRCSPPALLVSPSGARLLPAQPGQEESAQLSDGDVLLVCSAGVLDAEPTGLGKVLAWSPRRLALHEPAALLEQLMDGVAQGAAAVVRCTEITAPSHPRAHRSAAGTPHRADPVPSHPAPILAGRPQEDR